MSSQIAKWIIGSLTTLLLAMGSSCYMNTSERISATEISIERNEERDLDLRERVTTVEANQQNQTELLREIRQDMKEVKDAVRGKY